MRPYLKFSDKELAALLKGGDELAYTEIFERYTEILLRHAYRLLTNEEQAADIVQDVFMNLWQKHDAIDFKSNLSGFLYTSVRNKIFDFLSHQKVVIRYAEQAGHFMAEGYPITDDLVRERELARVIEREINALPEKMRVIFLLNKQEGLSYKEIAAKLHISDQTAKQQVYKALKILKPKMDSFLSAFPFL
ncbi:MAG: RNA polymerase sigma-70 factor [Bacteroidota bacterium]